MFSELKQNDWNNAAIKDVEENGNKASGFSKYSASKTLAEKAVWKFVEQNKSEINFDVATILPVFIYGVSLVEAERQRLTKRSQFTKTPSRSASSMVHPCASSTFL